MLCWSGRMAVWGSKLDDPKLVVILFLIFYPQTLDLDLNMAWISIDNEVNFVASIPIPRPEVRPGTPADGGAQLDGANRLRWMDAAGGDGGRARPKRLWHTGAGAGASSSVGHWTFDHWTRRTPVPKSAKGCCWGMSPSESQGDSMWFL